MNAAEMRCGPALMWMGGVRTSIPFWPLFCPKSVSVIVGRMSSSATRSPLIETSSCSTKPMARSGVLPNRPPSAA